MIDEAATGAGENITLGISVEPVPQVAAALASIKSAAQPGVVGGSTIPTKMLAQRIAKNAFNFLTSFGGETVPVKAFMDWWKKFEAKIERDPGFLERNEQD